MRFLSAAAAERPIARDGAAGCACEHQGAARSAPTGMRAALRCAALQVVVRIRLLPLKMSRAKSYSEAMQTAAVGGSTIKRMTGDLTESSKGFDMELSVSDSGCGIEPSKKCLVFRPFSQARRLPPSSPRSRPPARSRSESRAVPLPRGVTGSSSSPALHDMMRGSP